MTQYMLKLLAILTNIIVSNLFALKSDGLDPTNYIRQLVDSLRQGQCVDIKL